MSGNQPQDPADQVLLDFLAAQRDAVLSIVAGLDEEAWHRSVVPSGWTPACARPGSRTLRLPGRELYLV